MRGATIVLGLALLSSGCDKLKGALSKGDAGASGSGGILSFLGTDFEGEITANVTSKSASAAQKGPSGPMSVVFGIHKPKFRIDASGSGTPSGGIIIDPQQKKAWTLIPAQKMAMVLDFDKMKAMKGQIPGLPNAPKTAPGAPATPPKIDKTGKTEVVAGYSCEIWNITSETTKAEACMAEGITWVDLTDLGFASPEFTAAAVASGANHFPLRVVAYDAKGAEQTRMEVTKVDKKKLDDARFVVPPDYRVVDMAQMMGGLGLGHPVPPALPKR